MNVLGLDLWTASIVKAAVTIEFEAKKAVEEETKAVAETMRAHAPVLTGALRDSISYEIRTEGTRAIGEAGPTVPYGAFVEFGTSYSSPQPYAEPAALEHEGSFVERIADAGEF
jgi:HK97 gp10 family phage protein